MISDREHTKIPLVVVVAAIVTAALVSVLTLPSKEPAGNLVSHLRERHEAAGGTQPFDSLDDLLDNVRYSMPGRETGPLTDAVVVGRVQDVVEGKGFYAEGGDAPSGTETEYNDERVEWRTVHVIVDIERLVSGSADKQVAVGFSFGDAISFEQIRSDFMSFERIVLFLQKDQPVFAYDRDVLGTIMDGALLGTVSSDGSIALPVLEDSEEARLTRGTPSVTALVRAAQGKPRHIELDASGVVVGGELD